MDRRTYSRTIGDTSNPNGCPGFTSSRNPENAKTTPPSTDDGSSGLPAGTKSALWLLIGDGALDVAREEILQRPCRQRVSDPSIAVDELRGLPTTETPTAWP